MIILLRMEKRLIYIKKSSDVCFRRGIRDIAVSFVHMLKLIDQTGLLLLVRVSFIETNCRTAWEVSVFGVFLIYIFPHLDRIRRYTLYLVFSPNTGKYGPEKLQIRTLFTQYVCWKINDSDEFHTVKCIVSRNNNDIPKKIRVQIISLISTVLYH